ncbi:unnamed protein product [Candidula unifasciata]|uniref:Beta-1,3-galactosyl-O-glycosyl-glycoprotein beta-1,6-N-acetylglucosaminyltransferase n=1 Tax=Candidula unifasciata TaxID=100452 RepID=A0A8S3YLI9_9EUPU|nr:unnamed protein product [Candidula unifasciata]
MKGSKCTRLRCLATLIVVAIASVLLCCYCLEVDRLSVKSERIQWNRSLIWKDAYVGRMSITGHTTSDYTYVAQDNLAETLKHIASMHKVPSVNCHALFNDSQRDIEFARNVTKNITSPISDLAYLSLTADCRAFVTSRGYILSPLTKEEEDFPLAFSMLTFKDVEMVERLLKAIYRPQNYYCIHVDKKSPDSFYQSVASIAKCFPNVFIATRRIDVQWGWFSVLEPELECMKELWRYPKWKYFFTLTGQEFPLKTNFELVKILSVYDGANDIEGTIKRANKNRFRTTPPLGITPVKGSVHITVNRDFVGYILHNKTAKALLEWAKNNVSVPDETYFATLNHNPQLGVRGAYKGVPETDGKGKPFLTRFKNWGSNKCAGGQYVRAICILTLGDLPLLGKAKHYFANKFYLSEDRVVIGCLEEKIFNDTRDEYLGVKTFDTSYYANLSFVKNKV